VRLRGRVGARARSICGRLAWRACKVPWWFSLCIHNYHHRFPCSHLGASPYSGRREAIIAVLSNSHRVTLSGKRTLEMTYAYYVCATVIDDETAVMCSSTTQVFFFFFFFFSLIFLPSRPSIWGAHMVPFVDDQAQIPMCIRRLVFSSLGLCTYSLVSPSFLSMRSR